MLWRSESLLPLIRIEPRVLGQTVHCSSSSSNHHHHHHHNDNENDDNDDDYNNPNNALKLLPN